jgi:ATP-dependent DNA helicase PIF1
MLNWAELTVYVYYDIHMTVITWGGVTDAIFGLLSRTLRRPTDRAIVLSKEQQKVVDLLNTSDDHIFVTGKAGAGKSVVLDSFVHSADGKQIIKVAPTGIAAMHISGQTIHATFRLPIGLVRPHMLLLPKLTRQMLREIDVIVVDEISMVRADIVDGIDRAMQLAKGNSLPFGGAQFVAFGDLYQLPPVVADDHIRRYLSRRYDGPHFFNAHVWGRSGLRGVVLEGSFRQTDDHFLSVLNAVRDGSFSGDDMAFINTRSVSPDALPENDIIILTTTVASARKINARRLAQLRGKSWLYRAISTGETLKNALPVDEELLLKKGAQVIFVKNDPDRRWVNGDTGIVKHVSKTKIRVLCKGHIHDLEPEMWEQTKYYYDEERETLDQMTVGTFTQFPIRLAWAVTIHKSQGQTYDRVAIDLRDGTFAPGQAYVALSRCRSLAGLYLLGELEKEDIIVDPTVSKFITMVTR